MTKLITKAEKSILECLSTNGADTVANLRNRTAFAHFDARAQATIHTALLKKMEARGIVRRLDDQKPIAWMLCPTAQAMQ